MKSKNNSTLKIKSGSPYECAFVFIVTAFAIVTLTLNSFHHSFINDSSYVDPFSHPSMIQPSLDTVKTIDQRESNNINEDGHNTTLTNQATIPQQKKENLARGRDDKFDPNHTLAGLNCEAYGGPSKDIAQEMVYWSDIPSDSKFISPFFQGNHANDVKSHVQYMTFEPDGGGWNNIRMAMETVVVLAHAMGRTLVLPPAQGIYLMKKDRRHNVHFTFADFFHLESVANEHAGLDIISMEEFLEREAMTGRLRHKETGEISFPPGNRTDWNGIKDAEKTMLKEYLRNVTHTPTWKPGSCLAAFPTSNDSKDIEDLYEMLIFALKSDSKSYFDSPTPVDSDSVARMKEQLAGRKDLCVYDEEMQFAPVVHMMCYPKQHVRLLTHFYTFIFFEDWKQQMWAHRFVRDHLRYVDELQCAAARVVHALREIARKQPNNPDGLFDSMHIRRGDFQFKETRLDAPQLYEKSKQWVPEKSVVFISTDERDKSSFFGPFKEHYEVYFLDDFKHLFPDMNTNLYGMLDQLVATRGRTFVGTYFSTFTGYINRMRGYHVNKMKTEGYELGKVNSYFFTKKQDVMNHYTSFDHPLFAREFPFAWRDIDKGVNMLE
jgi:hypothetical protein